MRFCSAKERPPSFSFGLSGFILAYVGKGKIGRLQVDGTVLFLLVWFVAQYDVIFGAVAHLVGSARLYLAVWLRWLPRDKDILFVHSDSPVWRDSIEQHLLPVIRERAVILNWSQRSTPQWGASLAVAVFYHFGGPREFNPMAIVFLPFRRARVFRFHAAFRDYKHGKPEKLLAMTRELLDCSRARRKPAFCAPGC